MSAPCIGVQIVNEIAASDNQNALVAQRRELSAYIEMKGGRLSLVDAKLDDRNVSSRIDMAKHRPCAVVQTPGVVQLNGQRLE